MIINFSLQVKIQITSSYAQHSKKGFSAFVLQIIIFLGKILEPAGITVTTSNIQAIIQQPPVNNKLSYMISTKQIKGASY